MGNRILSALILLFICINPLAGGNERNPDDDLKRYKLAGPHFREGKRLFLQGKSGRAVRELVACTERLPEHVFAHYYLSNIYYANRDYASALESIKKALRHFDFMIELTALARQKEVQLINDFRDALGDYYESSNSCREGRRMEEAFMLMDQDEQQVTGQKFKQWERLKSQYQSFYGSILFQLKKYGESFQQYQAAMKNDPQNGRALNNIIAILYLSGRHREARCYLETAVDAGVEDQLNLKLKKLVFESLGLSTDGILEQFFTGSDIDVLRLAINVWEGDSARTPLYMNAYLVIHRRSRQCVIVDPGARDPRISDRIKRKNLQVMGILNTHGHWDHVQASDHYAGLYNVPVFIHKKDLPMYKRETGSNKADVRSPGSDTLKVGDFTFRVLHVPGHTGGSNSYAIEDFLISGDTIFEKSIGKLPGETPRAVSRNRKVILKSIRHKLLILPENTRVLPGHGQSTTIGKIKKYNPYFESE